jgi:hypothetical protein
VRRFEKRARAKIQPTPTRRSIARLDLYGIYMEIRDEDVAGLQSALRLHARIDAGLALMEFVSPRMQQPKDQVAVADACQRTPSGRRDAGRLDG